MQTQKADNIETVPDKSTQRLPKMKSGSVGDVGEWQRIEADLKLQV